MKKIIIGLISVAILSLPISSWAGKAKKLNLDSGSVGSKNKISAVKKAVVLAPVTLLAGGVLHIVNNPQKTQPPVAIKTQLLAKFKEYKSTLPENLTQQEQIDAFISEKYAEIYLDLMRNVNLNKGPVLWGGDLEIAAIVLKYKICIRVIDNDQGTDVKHGEEYETKITIKRQGGHYKYINVLDKEFDVPSDGSCMFTAILIAAKEQKIKMFPKNVVEFRNDIIDYIEHNSDLKKNIISDNDSSGEKIDGKHTLEEIVNNFLSAKYIAGRDYYNNMTDEEVDVLLDKFARNELIGSEIEKAKAIFFYENRQKINEKTNGIQRKRYYIGREYHKVMTIEEINNLLDKLAKNQLTGVEKEKAEGVLVYEKRKTYDANCRKQYDIGRKYLKNMTDEKVRVLLDKFSKNQLKGAEKEKAETVLVYINSQKNKEKRNKNRQEKYRAGRDYCDTMVDAEIKNLLNKLSKNQLVGVEKEKAKAVFYYERCKYNNRILGKDQQLFKERIEYLQNTIDRDNKLEGDEQEGFEVMYEDEDESEDLAELVQEFLLRNPGMGL